MQEKPYFCPNCRGNRTKFRLITRNAQHIQKDAFDGSVKEMGNLDSFITEQGDTEVECLACNYIGYEMMFIKAAEREPRQRMF